MNPPGSYYTLVNEEPSAVKCPQNTYGPGLKKQRACVPCPPGYTTQAVNKDTGAIEFLDGRSSKSACGELT